MNNPVIIFFLVIVFAVNVFILIYAVTRKDNSRSVYLALLALASSMYVMGSIIYGLAETVDGALNALRVINLGVPLLAPGLLLLVISLYRPKILKPWMLYAAVVYGIMVFLVVLFNHEHQLYYSTIEFAEPGHYMHVERGILFWLVNQSVAAVCMILAYAVMLERFIRGGKKIRRQMIYIIIGSIVVFIANIVNFTEALPNDMDPLPFVMTIAMVLFTVDTARHKLWDIVAAASNTALNTMSDAMIILNDEWGFLYCNNSARTLFPSLESFPVTELITKAGGWPHELSVLDKFGEQPDEPDDTDKTEKTGGIVFEHGEAAAPYNQKPTYRATINKIINEYGTQLGWYIVMQDITDMTFIIGKLENLATTDALTGIANRRHFLDRVTSEMNRAMRIGLSNALIMYDLDFFKKVNDTYGHPAGDYILCAVVEVIKQQLRSYDIIARYGGEEFVIFIASNDEDTLYKFANRLCKAVETAEFIFDGARIPVTASFGAVQIEPGDSFEAAMYAVDEAMYKAKNNGRNQVVVGKIKREEQKQKQES